MDHICIFQGFIHRAIHHQLIGFLDFPTIRAALHHLVGKLSYTLANHLLHIRVTLALLVICTGHTDLEERELILAYQADVPGSIEMILTFFSPKIIAALKPPVFGITPDNHEDIEAVCLGSLDRLLKSLNPDIFDAGLPPNPVSLELSNGILEEFGQSYSIPIHRRQINHLQKLHSMMQDPDFASKSQSDRSAEAGIPLAIVIIYNSRNAHANGSDRSFHGTSTHMDIQDDYLNSSALTALPSLALSLVEAEYDASIAQQDELFANLTEVITRWLKRHHSRPSVAGKKILKEFSEIKEKRRMTDEEFDCNCSAR